MAGMESWEDADEEDDWAVTDLGEDTAAAAAPAAAAADDDEEWCTTAKPVAAPAPAPAKPAAPKDERPLILVNFTALSDGKIHNRADPHACNDPEAKSALAKRIEADYAKYANDADLIAKGHVRPSAMGVWRAALATLRLEEAGQYYAPVFPPSV